MGTDWWATRIIAITRPQARTLPHVGAMLNPNLEKIVALKPDLVLGTDEANRRETADQLERLGIPLYGVTAHTVDGTLQSLQDLGRILDWDQPTEKLVASLRARVAAVDKQVQGQPRPKVLFVVWYRPLITAGSQTFISNVIRCAGRRFHQRRPEERVAAHGFGGSPQQGSRHHLVSSDRGLCARP